MGRFLRRLTQRTAFICWDSPRHLCEGCRSRFESEVRNYVSAGVKVLIFIMRTKKYHEVDAKGNVGSARNWG